MRITDAIQLIAPAFGKRASPQTWADLGCGNGLFTEALAHHLPADSKIVAIDRNEKQLNQIMANKVAVQFWQGDFENDFPGLSGLDGILMANSFHFIANKKGLIKSLESSFADKPLLLLVEYDTDIASSWVPYPVSFTALERLFKQLGYRFVQPLNKMPSAFGGDIYAALIE